MLSSIRSYYFNAFFAYQATLFTTEEFCRLPFLLNADRADISHLSLIQWQYERAVLM